MLAVSPWIALDGPSVACAAAALQLLPENIHHLGRLQRLAAIGVSLPERPGALRLSPSRLRTLLKHPLVSGADVRANQDPYDDVYVVEVPFHGGPRRVLQGLTSQSAATLNLLLLSVLSPVSREVVGEHDQVQDRVDSQPAMARTARSGPTGLVSLLAQDEAQRVLAVSGGSADHRAGQL